MHALEHLISERGISPTALAAKSRVSERYLLKVRRGQIEPTVKRAARIVVAINELTGECHSIESLFVPTKRKAA